LRDCSLCPLHMFWVDGGQVGRQVSEWGMASGRPEGSSDLLSCQKCEPSGQAGGSSVLQRLRLLHNKGHHNNLNKARLDLLAFSDKPHRADAERFACDSGCCLCNSLRVSQVSCRRLLHLTRRRPSVHWTW
jgi:hypothetical protein